MRRSKRQPINNEDGTFSIPLTRGQFAIIDAGDLSKIENYTWHADECDRRPGEFYAKGRIGFKSVRMHRFLLDATFEQQVDHVNSNGLDNRRTNIRIVTGYQNMANRRKTKLKSSPYKGVSWDKQCSRWRARVRVNKKLIFLGKFKNIIDAALAYNKAALQYFGEYARLNDL